MSSSNLLNIYSSPTSSHSLIRALFLVSRYVRSDSACAPEINGQTKSAIFSVAYHVYFLLYVIFVHLCLSDIT